MTVFSTSVERAMTMQKPCQNGQTMRQQQQQYVRPDSPAPSSVKKSPLAMLVDACSNIGQELTKTNKSDNTGLLENRKARSTASPSSNSGSKPNSPPPPYSQQQRIMGASTSPLRPKGDTQSQASKEQLSAAASLASQYQLMYQQLLYQTELEYLQRSKGASAAPLTQIKNPQELVKSGACNLCRMSPGNTGYCVHENNSSVNQMLAMLNPGSAAAAVLAYSSKLASFQQPYVDTPLPTIYPAAPRTSDSANLSPTSQSLDSRRTSASSASSTSPRRHISPRQNSSEQPMDLHIEKSKSPAAGATKLIECHWVGAEGYCGKRFHSQDDLMQHLKHHVATCPNVVTPEEEPRSNSVIKHQTLKSSPTYRGSYKHRTSVAAANSLLTIASKQQSARFQPYSVTERGFPNSLLLGTPR